ncbi:MAG: hypothetical protein JXR60_08970 [Bacteroidales bacterium]|nr:hypothetical protein [Bacteroidales bacterium]
MKRFLLIVLASLWFWTVSAQTTSTEQTAKKVQHAIGADLGFTIGYGLAYRATFNNFSTQLSFTPYSNDSHTRVSAGLSFYYTLKKHKVAEFFLYQGTHYIYDKNEVWDCIVMENDNCVENTYTRVDNSVNIGAGLGIKLNFFEVMSFSLMGGYAGYDNFSSIGFTGEAVLLYHF